MSFPSSQFHTYFRMHAHIQVVLYEFARERAATTRLPWPFLPLRDGVILPCFRAVEYTVQFALSDRPVSEDE